METVLSGDPHMVSCTDYKLKVRAVHMPDNALVGQVEIQMDGRASGRLPARDENFLVGLERVMGSCCRTAESQYGRVPSSAKDGRCVICERAGVGEPRRLQPSGDSHIVACCTSVVSLSC